MGSDVYLSFALSGVYTDYGDLFCEISEIDIMILFFKVML